MQHGRVGSMSCVTTCMSVMCAESEALSSAPGRKLQGSQREVLAYGRKLQGADRELLAYYGRRLQGTDRGLLAYYG